MGKEKDRECTPAGGTVRQKTGQKLTACQRRFCSFAGARIREWMAKRSRVRRNGGE